MYWHLYAVDIPVINYLVGLIPPWIREGVAWMMTLVLLAGLIGLASVYISDWRHEKRGKTHG